MTGLVDSSQERAATAAAELADNHGYALIDEIGLQLLHLGVDVVLFAPCAVAVGAGVEILTPEVSYLGVGTPFAIVLK